LTAAMTIIEKLYQQTKTVNTINNHTAKQVDLEKKGHRQYSTDKNLQGTYTKKNLSPPYHSVMLSL
jgi:hypothetical protein